jgi:hypothetical protein
MDPLKYSIIIKLTQRKHLFYLRGKSCQFPKEIRVELDGDKMKLVDGFLFSLDGEILQVYRVNGARSE